MITIHEANSSDFSTLGLGALAPTECLIEESAGGLYELTLTQPIADDMKHGLITQGRIIKAPAPMRETPLVEIGQSGTVTRRIFKVVTDGRRLSLRTAPDQSARVIHAYKPGTEVIVTDTSGSWSSVIMADGGASGWMWTANLTFVREESESISGDTPGAVIQPRQTREQLFRICEVETDSKRRVVTLRAQHISYDLKGVIVASDYAPEDVSAETVCAAMMRLADHETPFRIICTVTDPITIDCTGRNILDIIMDSDSGILAQTGARLIRDNYDLFILPAEERKRGVSLRYGKNLLSAYLRTDTSNLLTRIQPAGKTRKGDVLLISDDPAQSFVDSSRLEQYPTIYAKRVEYDVVESKELSKDEARAQLRERAQAEFDAGCDLPSVRLDADFVRLDLAEDYKELANAYALHLYDVVPVIDEAAGIVTDARMTGYKYDVLLDRYDSTKLGELTDADVTVYGYEIAAGSVSGSKIIPNSVSGDRLRDFTVSYAKITQAAIQQLSTDSLTAVKAEIGRLAAGEITTDQLYADLAKIAAAQITTANIKNANIDWATIENLSAQIAAIAKAEIEDANIGFAQIDGLEAKIAEITLAEISKAVIHAAQIDDLDATVAEIATAKITSATIKGAQIEDASITSAKIALGAITAALIEKGAIGTAQIADGSITEAKIVSLNADVITAGTLSVDRLLIKGPNGLFRAINATDAGLTSTELSQEEYQNGMSGTVLVARSVTADKIAAKSITANEILGGTITAAEIDVSNLFAAEAVITQLDNYILRAATIEAIEGKLDIWANDKISIAVRDKADKGSVDELSGRVSTNETAIKATQDSLSSKVSRDDFEELTGRVSTAESNITQQADQIKTKVSQSDFNTGLAGKADTGDLSALKTRVSSAESSITQNANAISSKVSQSDFNALGQRVSSAESSISQTPNQISAAVSAVKVGSRNYILGTAAAYPALGGGSERRWLFPWKCAGFDVLKTLYGKTVTISFDYDQWINSGSFQVMINLSWQGVVTLDSNGNGNNKHFEKTMTLNTVTFESTNENVAMYIDGTWSGTVTFRNVKMEVGNKATDWTAAPEDSIGGTNLLYCSNDMGASGNHGFWTDSSGADNKGVGEWQADGSVLVTNNNSNFRFGQSGITVTDGDVLTISAEYKDVSGDPPHQFQVTIYDSSGNMCYNYASVGAKTNIGGGWVRSSYTFAIPHGGVTMNAWFRSGTDYTLYTHSYYIRRAKLERGSVASDWSQNPEEVRIGSAIILDERHTEIKTPYLDIDVTGTNGDTHIDENGLATGTGTFDHVNCPELVPSVPGQTFTVTTSSGLQEVFDKLGGSVVNGNVTIDIQVDQYGTFMLRGLHGRWSTIEIQAHWHSINGTVILGDCYTNAIRFYQVLFNGDGTNQPLQIYNTTYVDIQSCTINGNNADKCIDANCGSKLFIYDTGLYNATNLIRLGHTTDASIVNILGGNCTSYLRADGARFTMSGTRPDGSYAEENTCLKAPSDPNSLAINYGTAQPTVTPVTTASFTASATGTFYPSNHFIKSDNIIRQGYEGSGSSARADYGCMWFGASALSGKTIKSATLSLTRIKGKGGSSAVTLTLYSSPLTGKDGNLRDGLTSHGEIGSIANGERLQVNIPVEAVSTVAAGGALVLYTGETSNASGKSYSRHYAHFEGTDGAAPVLTVTYQ